ncbi:MAG: PD-(D/E)XK nuclease domain-containing protein [Atopobiaceae bacterium]|nr:PD-(D/E)XK nuclease domain-containing protein [Atopobiaceae bacterium]
MAFDALVREWFVAERGSYNDFVKALLACDSVSMEEYLSDLATGVMSSFDSGVRPSRRLPERFWHGLVLGLIVELRGRYEVRSNPQSGMGRRDVLLAPLDGPDGKDLAFVIEFKVFDKRRGEKTLKDTVTSACQQIEQKGYATTLAERSILTSRIRYLGIGFRGQEVKVEEGALPPQY